MDTNKLFSTYLISQAKIVEPSDKMTAKASEIVTEAAEKLGLTDVRQPDLVYMEDILVSTGTNKNDDEFLPEELLKAVLQRNSIPLKPVNWEHDPKDVIGVMYDSDIYDKEGNLVDVAAALKLKEFDVVDKSVLWPVVDYEKVSATIEGAKDGSKFVSMECFFPHYDYRVGAEIVERNESTSFLDDYLRVKGGTGYIKGKKINRVLRDFFFGGKGVVDKPANERSQIKSVANEENKMTLEEMEAKVKELEVSLAEEKTKIEGFELEKAESAKKLEDLTKSLEESERKYKELHEENENLKTELATKESSKAELETAKKSIEDELATVKADLDLVQSNYAKLQAEVAELKKVSEEEAIAKKLAEREAALAKIVGAEEAKASLEDYKSLSDETFNKQIDLMTKAFEKGQAKVEAPEEEDEDPYRSLQGAIEKNNLGDIDEKSVNSNSYKESFASVMLNRKK